MDEPEVSLPDEDEEEVAANIAQAIESSADEDELALDKEVEDALDISDSDFDDEEFNLEDFDIGDTDDLPDDKEIAFYWRRCRRLFYVR